MKINNPTFLLIHSRYGNDQYYEANDIPLSLTSAFTYRFGFNGQQKENDISGTGNHNTAKFWEYDTRLGKRWNLDPVIKPGRSPYDVFNNNPIINIDPTGDDDYRVNSGGHISLVKTVQGSTVDRLILSNSSDESKILKTKKNGELRNSYISVQKGYLNLYKGDNEHNTNGHSIDFGANKEEATKVFNFVADVTAVEFSVQTVVTGVYENGNKIGTTEATTLYTTHDDGSESLGTKALRKLSYQYKVESVEHTHNHPR